MLWGGGHPEKRAVDGQALIKAPQSEVIRAITTEDSPCSPHGP